jgi:hypothetical protein
VTIVEAGGPEWTFAFTSRSDLVDLCYAPLPESGRHRATDNRQAWRTAIPFGANGRRVLAIGASAGMSFALSWLRHRRRYTYICM